MSVRCSTAIWKDSPYSGSDLLVLLALADWADDDGVCWPSIPVIASKARVTERQVYASVARFKKAGVLSVERSDLGHRGNHYHLHLATLKSIHPEISSPENAFRSPLNVVQVTPENIDNPTIKNRHLTTKGTVMVRPSLAEVARYCQERGNQVDPEKWLNHYTANGWRVGKVPMRDWKAAVRTWEGSNYANGNGKPSKQDRLFAECAKARASVAGFID